MNDLSKSTESATPQDTALRRRAEGVARVKALPSPEDPAGLSPEVTRRTLHELRVHQIELEMQNEELRRAQVDLEAARERYFDLYNLAPVGYCTISEKGLILEANLTAASMLGVARDALVQQPISRLILKEDQDIYYLHRKKLFESGEPQTCELRMVKKDRTPFWVRLESLTVQDTDDAPAFRVIMADITERKQTERTMQEYSSRLHAILEAVPDIIMEVDCNKVYTWANRVGVAFFGEDVIGKEASFYFEGAQETYSSVQPLFTGADDSRVYYVESWQRRRDGQKRLLAWWCRALKDSQGTTTSVLGTARDISDRYRADEALRESEEKFSIAFQTSPYAITITRAKDGKFIEVNDAFTTMTGITLEEAHADSSIGLKLWMNIDDRDRVVNDLRAGRTIAGHEYQFRTKGGKTVAGLFSARAILLSGEQCILSCVQDITKRKHAEDKLRRLRAELELSNQELEHFASIASHDLQEPLRMVASYTQLLAERYVGQLDEKAQKYIAYAFDGAIRMQRLVNDLLTYSRVGTRGNPIETTDSHLILGEAIRNLATMIEESKAIVTDEGLPMVRADASQLVQVFQNLLANAIKFHGEDVPRVHVSARGDGREWIFSVRDNGIGIDRQYADRIFAIFQRLHTRQEYPGTGIGLSVCKRIVERHGGKIWFESEPGKGSTFFFKVPKHETGGT